MGILFIKYEHFLNQNNKYKHFFVLKFGLSLIILLFIYQEKQKTKRDAEKK
jgi:hypothetical protein